MANIEALFERYVHTVIPSKEEAVRRIASSREPLTVYLGIDPTGPDIHLGHSTNLLWLREWIAAGQKAVLLIGDFTAQIGDPTGKDAARASLTRAQVEENMASYLDQVHKILAPGSFQIAYNSDWLGPMTFTDVVKLASHITVQQMIVRDMFQRRLEAGNPIHLHEFFYPLMQGYDSVALNIDAEVGGNDQFFNMMMGRELLQSLKHKDKLVITTKLLEDPTTGKKIMNKSEGRYVSLRDSAEEMFGKIMAMPDSAIIPLLTYATTVPLARVTDAERRLISENPKNIKQEVAREIVTLYHGDVAARDAQDSFEKIFTRGELPESIQEVSSVSGNSWPESLVAWELAESKAAAKRLIEQGAVRLNGEKVTDWATGPNLKSGDVIQVGSREFRKVK
ncbi:MAG: tyrosine--tRNA ligase [Patescibacteria group bacterium]